MTKYNYKLNETLRESLVWEQEKSLFDEGFVYNKEEQTYDLYEIKYEEIEYVNFSYIEEKEVKSQLLEFEVFETKKVFDVKYKIIEKEKGLFWFFKNIFNRFVSKTEKDVSNERLNSLELRLGRWEISNLQKIESLKLKPSIVKMTENEEKKLREKWQKYSFLGKVDDYKNEIIEIENNLLDVEYKTYLQDYEPKYETFINERYKEKIQKEKLVIDRRKKMETTINFYIPWIWSYNGTHEFGSIAEFSCQVIIEFISGFNPLDDTYFSYKETKEKIIKIINKEHFNAKYIRERGDGLDGFNIENSHIN